MKTFPIMHGKALKAIPWDMIAPHEAQADDNHRQSLKTLASRGGLSPCEAVAVLEDRRWREDEHAEMTLVQMVRAFSPADGER